MEESKKPSVRKCAMPILITKEQWGRIAKWTDSGKDDPETVRRREYIKQLNDTSREMTKSWPNSLENVNKRNEEIRQARLAAAEQTNSKFYRRYVARRRDQQRRLMHSARDTVFKNKDAPKLLLSAVIETVVQKERAEQVKFNSKLRQMEAEQRRRDDDDTIRRAREWHALNDQRAKKRQEVNKQHQQDIVDQALEHSERTRKEHEAELNMQKVDNLLANKEMEAIKEFEEEIKVAEKRRIFEDMERAKQETAARRQHQADMDRMDDRLQDVLLRSKARVERRRHDTEKELRDEKQRVLEAISHKLESGDAARDAKEKAALNKAIAEREANEEARRQAQLAKEAKFRQQRVASREQFLRDEARRLHELHNTRSWELVNRFKNQEIYEEFMENQEVEKKRKIKEYREEILRLWKEREDRETRERAETRHFYGELAVKKLRDADNKLLTHAAALLDEARAHGRPELPLHKAIDRYCKLYRLYPMPELPASLQEHFARYAPWDGSGPDPWYTEPPPPPPDRGPDATDEDEASTTAVGGGRKDGLQDVVKPTERTKEMKKETKEETVYDYKRAAPANGLQRNAQADVSLPPITVTQCKTGCGCPRALKRTE